LHKGFSPLFNPAMPEEAKKLTLERLLSRFDYLATQLQSGPYLLGSQFTVADAYLFVMLRWSGAFSIELSRWPALETYFRRVEQRPAVQAALAAEK
jgi:glutathione S-transferase